MQRTRIITVVFGVLAFLTTSTAFALNFSKMTVETNFPGSSRPFDIHVADINADGEQDLVATVTDFAGSEERLVWYQNNGSEVFSKQVIDSLIVDPGPIDVADVNSSSFLDIVLGTTTGIFWYENDGTGVFTSNPVDPTISSVRELTVIDLDEDLDQDILVLTSDGVFWEENDGFQVFTRRTILANPVADDALGFGDFDNDFDLDVVAFIYDISDGDRLATWFENDGSENFTSHAFHSVPNSITALAVADLDRNGSLDLVVTMEDSNEIDWYRNDGTYPTLFVFDVIQTDFIQSPRALNTADLDNDLDTDIVVVGGNSAIGEVVFYENDGSENFTKNVIDSTAGNRERVFVADIDDDTINDIFVSNNFPMEILMYKGLGPIAGVGEDGLPELVQLKQNRPNPFNPETVIDFELKNGGQVRIDVFGPDGVRIRNLVNREFSAGPHSISWDGRDDHGRRVASGGYFYHLESDQTSLTQKMTLLK